MSFFEDISESVRRLAVFEELDVEAGELPASALRLSDAAVRDVLAVTAQIIKQASVLQSVMAGVACARSSRERGHSGLIQESGHRNTVEFVRELTGATRAEATRAVKVGEALIEGFGDDSPSAGRLERVDAAPAAPLWHQPLREALLAGVLTTAQHDAIRRGLGEPACVEGRDPAEMRDVWQAAASRLVEEAATCTVEDLGARARALRDALDPATAQEREAARFGKRSLRTSVDADGLRRGHIVFDDEMGVWVEDLMRAALRPRRGGPRFVAEDEKAAAKALTDDARTNDQLAYDLLIDILRAGALAEAKDVYGSREPGVRLVAIKDDVVGDEARRDAFGRLLAVAHSEDGQLTLAGASLDRALCVTGYVEVTLDACGTPLDVGREERLFTSRQRLALAVRDGGCLWPGCDRPPAMCEAHHCDHWAEGGKTDCAVGVLLCRFHHLHLHNAGWRIAPGRGGGFLLHPPPALGEAPIPLLSKSPLRWLWDPPPERARWRVAA